ncbi:MAG: TonB-dependent receptor [Bacteroidales bacterium]|nr:TonB-dependent receptor [Bacteroidales bacterium]
MQIANVLLMASMVFPQAPDTLDVATVTDSRNIAARSSAPLQRVESRLLQETGTITLQEALRTFAGIQVKDYGGLGGMKTVGIRSFGSQHTGIMYDGQVISNAQNGQVDIGRFNLDDIKSISVEISGSDDIFRPARLATSAGVLSVESARPVFDSTGIQASAQLRYGSFGTWNPYLNVKRRLSDRWAGTFWGNYISSKGNYPFILYNGDITTREIRLHSDVSSFNGETSLYGDIGQDGSLAMRLSYYSSERGLPGSVVLYTQNPHQRLWDDDRRASASYEAIPDEKWKIKSSLSYDRAWNRFVDFDPIHEEPEDDRYLQREGSLSAIALFSPSTGIDFSAAQDLVFNSLDSSIPGCPFPERITSYTSLSGKYDRSRLTAVATLCGTVVSEWVKIGTPALGRLHFSPSASIAYRLPLDTDLRIRASFKDSFRLPTFNDLYYSRIGNRRLNPEKASQTNAGATWTQDFGKHSISAAADGYWNMVRDKIVAVPSMFIWSMRNVGKVLMLGSDLSFSYRGGFSDRLTIQASGNYSYQYAVDVTDPAAKNYRHQIAYTPRHCGSGSLVFETPWINMGYTMQAVGERYTLAQNTPAYRTEPYVDHSLSLNHTFSFGERHRWSLHTSAEALNISNVNYEVIKYYPMPGRQYRITLKISY